jgi:formylglycine-generating enzyme required for sulfatase activity/serine/threonine protein kinase
METRPASHPPADVLLALGSGKLDDATAEAIFFHVEVCPECLKIAGRVSGDSFLDKLRAARGYSGTPAPSKVISSFPGAGNTAPIPTTDERPALTILPELRDHPQYEVLRELGRGGMGVVYLANNKLMDRKEVLKVVNKQLLGEAGATERFLREIRSAAQLNHPNIVTAYSALQVGDVLLFSMEYIEGRDLAEVVKARGPLPAVHAGSYVLQAARGLQHAFEKGMVHRDIKPQNLILDAKKNIVKILDFGLAKATRATGEAAEGLTGMNMMMGTPDYMAPEQARDAANVDIRADIYSLGCTLYCLLAGRAPFVGGSLATKIAAHQLSEPEPIESLRKDLPPGLAGVVRKMMAKDPAQRYQKPEEVVQALTVCFKGKGKQPTAKGSPVKVVTAKAVAASKLSAKGEGKSIFEKKTVAPIAAPRQPMKERSSPVARMKNEETPLWRKKGLMAAGGAGVALMLLALIGLWAAGVFKVKTADGILVVQVNEPNAEVYVDGDRTTVSWNEGRTQAEIHVKPGTRKVEVKKAGFSADGTELTFKDGDRVIFTARLLADERPMAKADAPPPEKSPPPPAPVGTAENPAEITNSIDMRLKLIKPGTFLMGSPKGETGQSDNEQPQHPVEITRPFYLGVYPVTQAEYVQVTGQKNPSCISKEGGGKSRVEGLDTLKFPVEQVSWDEAVVFCEALNRLDLKKPAGWKYALPTEAEWEYACRAGTKSAYYFGSDSKDLGDYAWYDGNAGGRSHAVGTRMANPWGLYDMGGNVWQWCADGYDKYQEGYIKDPKGKDSANSRVLRGGSWYGAPRECRSAFRDDVVPAIRHDNSGFRVVLRLPARTP